MKKIVETRLLMSGIDYGSIKEMSEREIMEYFWIIQEIRKEEQEETNG